MSMTTTYHFDFQMMEDPLQKPLNEFLARRWAAWPPMTRTPEQNRKVVEIIIAKVLFAK